MTGGEGDADSDGLSDCEEMGDGNAWSDYQVFNGVRVQQAPQCTTLPGCSTIDTVGEIDSCKDAQTVVETVDQHAGWSWSAPTTPDICDAGHGSLPNWGVCGEDAWQTNSNGFISLPAGNNCFAVSGTTVHECTSLVLQGLVTQPGATRCYDLPAGVYPIRWLHLMDNNRSSPAAMDLRYCFGGASTCVPTATLPSSILRPIAP